MFPSSVVTSFVRHVLTLFGGILIANGWIDEATWTELMGSILVIFAYGWSYVDKVKQVS